MKKVFSLNIVSVIITAILLTSCASDPSISNLVPSNSCSEISSEDIVFQGIKMCTNQSDVGFYSIKSLFPNSLNITYIDYATQQELFLCNRPECLHNDDTCKSYIPLDPGTGVQPSLYLAGNTVLLIYSGASETSLPRIEAMELDGSNRHIVVEFEASQTLVPPYLFDTEFLYFSLTTQHEQPLSQTTEFIRVSLKDGTVESVYQFEQNINSLIAGTYETALWPTWCTTKITKLTEGFSPGSQTKILHRPAKQT